MAWKYFNGYFTANNYQDMPVHQDSFKHIRVLIVRTSAVFFRVRSVHGIKISSLPKRCFNSNGEDVLTEVINNKGVITLNRPKFLNALTLPMIRKILGALKEWESKVDFVVAKANGEKTFSSGGDVFKLIGSGPLNNEYGKNVFREEYTKVYTISQYKIPYIALIDGVTMGGGAGMSLHGKYCIATENTLFAMPEAAIGLCPDVGASYFFSRLKGKLGLYLALTGHRLQGKDVVKIGLASHYVQSKDVLNMFNDLIRLESCEVEKVIKNYSQDVSDHAFSLTPYIELINDAFSAPTVEEIIKRLQLDWSDFSKITLNTLNKMSPIVLKTVKVQLEKGAGMTLKECLQMEYRISKATCEATLSLDFYEGARALKEKRIPKWNPRNLEDVTDEMVNSLFLPAAPEEELKL